MTAIATFITNFKFYIVVGLLSFILGSIIAGTLSWNYVSAKKDNEILSITTANAVAQKEYSDKLITKERNNAILTQQLNERISILTTEKAKVLADIDRIKHLNVRVLNASCVPAPSKDGTPDRASSVAEESPSICRLDSTAESALFEYLSKVEEIQSYSKAAQEYIAEVEKQRSRMIEEQE